MTMQCSPGPFSVATQFTASTGKRSGHPRGMPLVTRLLTSKRTGVGTNDILECKFLSKNAHRTPQYSQLQAYLEKPNTLPYSHSSNGLLLVSNPILCVYIWTIRRIHLDTSDYLVEFSLLPPCNNIESTFTSILTAWCARVGRWVVRCAFSTEIKTRGCHWFPCMLA